MKGLSLILVIHAVLWTWAQPFSALKDYMGRLIEEVAYIASACPRFRLRVPCSRVFSVDSSGISEWSTRYAKQRRLRLWRCSRPPAELAKLECGFRKVGLVGG